MIYECKTCGKNFKQKGHYNVHLNKKYPCKVLIASININNTPEHIINAPEQSVNAPEQSVNAPEQPVNAPEQPVNAPEQLKISSNNLSLKIDEYKCTYCSKIFTRRYGLYRHITKYCKEKKYKDDQAILLEVTTKKLEEKTKLLEAIENENIMLKQKTKLLEVTENEIIILKEKQNN